MSRETNSGLNNLEYHVLLALAGGARYGYVIAAAVEEESEGNIAPRAGTLYRVIARLITDGLVREVPPPGDEKAHPGLARRWYSLTDNGREALSKEARRLSGVAALAEQRLRARNP